MTQTSEERAAQQRLIDDDKVTFGNSIAIEKDGELSHIPLGSELAKRIMASAWMDRGEDHFKRVHGTDNDA